MVKHMKRIVQNKLTKDWSNVNELVHFRVELLQESGNP